MQFDFTCFFVIFTVFLQKKFRLNLPFDNRPQVFRKVCLNVFWLCAWLYLQFEPIQEPIAHFAFDFNPHRHIIKYNLIISIYKTHQRGDAFPNLSRDPGSVKYNHC